MSVGTAMTRGASAVGVNTAVLALSCWAVASDAVSAGASVGAGAISKDGSSAAAPTPPPIPNACAGAAARIAAMAGTDKLTAYPKKNKIAASVEASLKIG